MIGVRYRRLDFTFPAETPPPWSGRVDRWYQLDAPAFGLCEAAHAWTAELERPGLILLASPGASNETDREFALSGATSPSKFVHTLPSVRASALCQALEWSGPALCFQRDPSTIVAALAEAESLVGESSPVLVLGVTSHSGTRSVHGFECFKRKGHYDLFLTRSGDLHEPVALDVELLSWLDPLDDIFLSEQPSVLLGGGTRLARGRWA